MIAIDTNVLVRYVTNDDLAQAQAALRILSGSEQVLITPAVLLELEWVLRAVYELSHPVINQAMHQVLGLPKVVVKDGTNVSQALVWHESGMDFADALHLALSADARVFFSFDRKLVAKAKSVKIGAELLR